MRGRSGFFKQRFDLVFFALFRHHGSSFPFAASFGSGGVGREGKLFFFGRGQRRALKGHIERLRIVNRKLLLIELCYFDSSCHTF
jgi:hypothetical protein